MRGSKCLLPLILLLLLLPTAPVAGSTVNPPPPITVEEAAGNWIGVDEAYSGVYALEIETDGRALLVYTSSHSDEEDVDLYRIDDWQQSRENVKPQATPVGDDDPDVKISGKLTRTAILLKVNRRGGAEHRVRMVRQEQLDAAMQRVRESVARAE